MVLEFLMTVYGGSVSTDEVPGLLVICLLIHILTGYLQEFCYC